jgi:predicted enzyme related to lactoylglutathione lyase
MSHITQNQPLGTPTWIDLGIPDLDRAMDFYGALFGWTFDVRAGGVRPVHHVPARRTARRRTRPNPDPAATDFWWNVYLATDDVDATITRAVEAGGEVVAGRSTSPSRGGGALLRDTVGAQFGLWQGSGNVGCEVVNEPGSLVRNDLVTPTPEPAREFYAAVFDFALEGNKDMPEADFTSSVVPDGHEVGGIFGNPAARVPRGTPCSRWQTRTKRSVEPGTPAESRMTRSDMLYGRIASLSDPFGTEFSVITRASG